jgi:hypothetical protein
MSGRGAGEDALFGAVDAVVERDGAGRARSGQVGSGPGLRLSASPLSLRNARDARDHACFDVPNVQRPLIPRELVGQQTSERLRRAKGVSYGASVWCDNGDGSSATRSGAREGAPSGSPR